MSNIDKQTQFRVLAPLGMTTTDATGQEHDRKPRAILSFADLHTSVRHLHTLIRVGDLEIYTPPPKKPPVAHEADVPQEETPADGVPTR